MKERLSFKIGDTVEVSESFFAKIKKEDRYSSCILQKGDRCKIINITNSEYIALIDNKKISAKFNNLHKYSIAVNNEKESLNSVNTFKNPKASLNNNLIENLMNYLREGFKTITYKKV